MKCCNYVFLLHLQKSECELNKFFISFNLILCAITSVISILPTVQEHQPRSGLLQSSVVTLYVVYLTWSSVSNNPGTKMTNKNKTRKCTSSWFHILLVFYFTDHECNPGFFSIISGTDNRVSFDKESIIGLIIWFSCVLYSSLRTASKSSKITMSENVLVQDNGAGKY